MKLASLLILSTFFIQTPKEQVQIHVTIARSQHEREAGFQNIEELEDGKGMLFVFDKPGFYPFWMDKTCIPLALLFLDQNYTVVDIKYGVPYSRNNIYGSQPYKYVLEVKPELVSKYQIEKGCKLIKENLKVPLTNEKKSQKILDE